MVTQANGFAEREAAKAMIGDACQAVASWDTEVALGADEGYDVGEFIEALKRMKVTPHVAQNKARRRSALADKIARSEGMRSRSASERSSSKALAGPSSSAWSGR